ncbi:sugar transferase [Candidatus Gracilibacteria bacterium]|nr:sugar transferase [Candidatus Gracilibacteria bacterium]
MKKHEIIFSTLRVPLDIIIVVGSFFIAKNIRLATDGIPFLDLPVQTIDSMTLLYFSLFGAGVYIFLFSLHGLYNTKLSNSKIKDLLHIIQYSLYWIVFFSFFIYAGQGIIYETEIPRLIILFTGILSMIGMIIIRIILNKIQSLLLKKNIINKDRLLIIVGENIKNLDEILLDIRRAHIYDIIGYLHINEIESPIKYLGKWQEYKNICTKNNIDEILYIQNSDTKDIGEELSHFALISGMRYRYIPHIFEQISPKTNFSLIHSFPCIEILSGTLTMWGRVWKRIFDIVFSLCILTLSLPFLCIIALLIKLEDSKGPIIYKNKRVGQNGKTFTLYKFRYLKWEYCVKESYGVGEMSDEALKYEQDLIQKQSSRKGPLYKIKNDPRKTKIGNFIEKYSIDELPQFFNVIQGDMSVVGPRPHQPREVEKYRQDQKRVLNIKPGITGMAQVNGREHNEFEQEIKLDIFYMEHWSYLLDLKIIFKTLHVIFMRK